MKIRVSIGPHVLVGDVPYEHRPGYFFTYDCTCTDYDWLVVFEDLAETRVGTLVNGYEPLCCPRERTIFCTWEPTSVKDYSRSFMRQFGHLLTNRPPEAERHPHYHLGRGYFFWFNDRDHAENSTVSIPPKTKVISAVCSAKQMKHTRHSDRYELMQTLSREIGGFDWYGRGVRSFGKKYEVMDPYKYHVAVENHIAPHHWTEKLTDAFLSGCLPFYAGAPDLADDFPRESFVPIPIGDPPAALEIIRSAVSAGEYGRRREALEEARRLVLGRYNFYAQVCEVIRAAGDDGEADGTADGRARVIRPRRAVRLRDPQAALEDALGHLKRAFSAGEGT